MVMGVVALNSEQSLDDGLGRFSEHSLDGTGRFTDISPYGHFSYGHVYTHTFHSIPSWKAMALSCEVDGLRSTRKAYNRIRLYKSEAS